MQILIDIPSQTLSLLGADARCQLRPVSMEDVFVERVTALEAEKTA